MRRVIIIGTLFLCFLANVHAESVMLNTPRGEQELYVPESYAKLREAYIDMAGLYLGERFDHERSIRHVDTLLSVNKQLLTSNLALRTTVDRLQSELDKRYLPDPIQHYIVFGPGAGIESTVAYGAYVGYGALLFERVMIAGTIGLPLTIQILVSVRL